ncbi:hypothetical protein RN001_000686 [Aquatica leii]|uniref:Microsomal glutathione S-transferase 1 n=1 Tax=Aquatica leii TaxID=1421715 RepID=A0AAN7SSH7_9COLE|nr:hypothetical protein RN001_000686 [Aquatica leii]
MLFMSLLTVIHRLKDQAFVNPEDIVGLNIKLKTSENVERVRRAHLNDLENILVFVMVSYAYIHTNPEIDTANMLFSMFTLARFVHTLVYSVYVMPQPARAISFVVANFITIYMTFKGIMHFM